MRRRPRSFWMAPSSTAATPNCSPMRWRSRAWFLNSKAEAWAATRKPGMRVRPSMISSVMPSPNQSWSFPWDKSRNGRTAIERIWALAARACHQEPAAVSAATTGTAAKIQSQRRLYACVRGESMGRRAGSTGEGRMLMPACPSILRASRICGADPWSARDALVPQPERRYQHPAKRGQADRASAAERSVRPTICADVQYREKYAALGSKRATLFGHGPPARVLSFGCGAGSGGGYRAGGCRRLPAVLAAAVDANCRSGAGESGSRNAQTKYEIGVRQREVGRAAAV